MLGGVGDVLSCIISAWGSEDILGHCLSSAWGDANEVTYGYRECECVHVHVYEFVWTCMSGNDTISTIYADHLITKSSITYPSIFIVFCILTIYCMGE